MVIELANKNHVPAIIEIEEKTWIAAYPNQEEKITIEDVQSRFDDEFKARRSKEIETEMNDSDHQYYVVIGDDEVIGYLHLMTEEKFNDLVEVYVLPDRQSQGIGAKLMEKTFEVFGDEKPICLEVARYNQAAIRFYERYGFEHRPDLTQAPGEDWNVLPSKQRIPVIFMEKR